MKIKQILDIKTPFFITIIFIITILPFIILSYYIHPNADDFCLSYHPRAIGLIQSQIEMYLNWTGRYFSTFLLSINPMVYGQISLIKIIPIAIYTLYIYSIYSFVKTLFPNNLSRDLFIIVFSIVILYFFQMPSIVGGLYWMPGVFTYQVANILMLFFFKIFLMYLNKPKNILIVYLSILGFGIIGSNEISMILLDVIMTVYILFTLLNKTKLRKQFIFLYIIFILFSIIVIKAPGNEIRSSHFTNNHNFIFSFKNSILSTKDHIIKWFPFTFLIIIILFDYLNSIKFKVETKVFDLNPYLIIFISFFLLALAFFGGYWSQGWIPPSRTINLIYFIFLLSIFLLFFSFYKKFDKKNLDFIKISKSVKYIFLLIILYQFFSINNIRIAYSDLISGKASDYNNLLNKRYTIVKESNFKKIKVEKITKIPHSIYFEDITSDSTDWKNKCFIRYFKDDNINFSIQTINE